MSLKYTLVILALTLACFVVSPAQAAITSAERKATLNFLSRFAVDFRGQLGSVWVGDDYCVWDGVTCDANDDVHVDLSNRGLRGSLYDRVKSADGNNARVASLDLSGNKRIRGDFPDSWASLRALRVLNLSGTSLRGNIPNSWNGMISLEEVSITDTKACRSLPSWSIKSLRRVDFANNRMRGSLASSWVAMPNLESLNLEGNAFCGCVPKAWVASPVLQAAVDSADNTRALRRTTCALTNLCGLLDAICV